MNEQNFDVNKLSVAKPCSMSWENMSGDGKTRLCNACDMNIYNLSEMTSKEITSLIQNREGRLCGRIYKRTDGTVMTKDCPVGLRAYRKKISRFAGAAFAAILSLFSISYAQNDAKASVDSNFKITKTENKETVLNGTIYDEYYAVIPKAEITLYDEKNKKQTIFSNESGEYFFNSLPTGDYRFEAKAPGFELFVIENLKINNKEQTQINIKLKVKEYVLMGDIIVNQNEENSIKGIVTDSNGAVIPNAEILLRKKNSKFKKETKSSDEGNFEIRKIQSGEYELEIKAEHFKSYKNSNLVIKENKTVELDVELEVEDVTVTVGIFVDEPLINTTNGSLTHTISGDMLRKLPINE